MDEQTKNYEFFRERLENFPYQYEKYIYKTLNDVWGSRRISNVMLEEIGQKTYLFSKYEHRFKTPHHEWFGKLEFEFGDNKLAVLFPKGEMKILNDGKIDVELERSISVYSNNKMREQEVGTFLEKLAYNTALRTPSLGFVKNICVLGGK